MPFLYCITIIPHQYFSKVRPDLYCESEVLYTEELLDSFFDGKNRKISIAKIGDGIVGYAFTEFLNIELPMMTKRKYVYIHDIAVREAAVHARPNEISGNIRARGMNTWY